ncbi:MAG TPA: polysaccharide deacetylase family protein [Nocardioidaceae bacterium]|nr:polysaccharide deacetylase family protein [Nocardioidaceae bacterium]
MISIPILLYHSISAQASRRFRPWAVPPASFAAHMETIARDGYEPVTVDRLQRLLHNGPMPARPVVITFDDGFEDFHSHALPVLDRHGFAATLYVPTGYIGGRAAWLAHEHEADRRMLGWTQVAEIAAGGVQIGAHSHTHPRLDELRPHESLEEIVRSKEVLEDRLQLPVTSFAYPHGYHDRRVRRQVIGAGYGSGMAVKHAMSSADDDRYALARIVVPRDATVDDVRRLLRGSCLRQAPFRTPLRTTGWRLVRRGRANVVKRMSGSVERWR